MVKPKFFEFLNRALWINFDKLNGLVMKPGLFFPMQPNKFCLMPLYLELLNLHRLLCLELLNPIKLKLLNAIPLLSVKLLLNAMTEQHWIVALQLLKPFVKVLDQIFFFKLLLLNSILQLLDWMLYLNLLQPILKLLYLLKPILKLLYQTFRRQLLNLRQTLLDPALTMTMVGTMKPNLLRNVRSCLVEKNNLKLVRFPQDSVLGKVARATSMLIPTTIDRFTKSLLPCLTTM